MKRSLTVVLFVLLAPFASSQVLQPLGTGLPGRVVASYATDQEFFALYEAVETSSENDYNLAKWDGVTWTVYPGLETPEPIIPTEGEYNFHSIAYFQGHIYVGAYIANASKDAEIPVTHLYKWSETSGKWVPEIGVVDTRNNGIISMTVFDGRLIVAGKFQSTVNGNSVQNIAAFDGNEWTYLGTNNLDQGANGIIRSLMVVKDRLYIAGDFDRFAGDLTGNIAYFTASNGGWGGIGSPFDGEILELASFGNQLAALGKNAQNQNEIRTFKVNWSDPIRFDSFSTAKPVTISGLSDYLLIGGDFVRNSSGSSLLRYQNEQISFTGNRLSGNFKLGQRGSGAFVWGDFLEQNTDIKYFSSLEFATGNLNGDLFYDVNNNCVKDDAELGIPQSVIRLINKSTQKSYFAVTDDFGHFSLGLPEGEYQIEHVSKRHMTSLCKGNFATQIRNVRYSHVSLAEYMNADISDVEVTFNPVYPNELKSGDTVNAIIQIKNHGASIIRNGTIHLTHALPLSDFYSNPAADDYNGIAAVFTVAELNPFETRSILVRFTMPFTSTIEDLYEVEVKTGSLLSMKDATPEDNTTKNSLSIGKRGNSNGAVAKSSDLGLEIPENERTWTYTVDFRNTSSQMVSKAVMIDTLSSNLPMKRVVLQSFYPTKAHYAIQQGRILVVTFDPANLKSLESSPSNAIGWVKYSVDLYENLKPNTKISNIAYMDFDSKWRSNSENCEVAVVKGASDIDKLKRVELDIHPNPTQNKLVVNWLPQELGQQWILMNSLGQISKSGYIQRVGEEIDLGYLPEGLYFLQTERSINKVQIIR